MGIKKTIVLKGNLARDNITEKYGSSSGRSLVDGDMIIFGSKCFSTNHAPEENEIRDLLSKGINIFFFLYRNNIDGALGSYHYGCNLDNDPMVKRTRRNKITSVSEHDIFIQYHDRYKDYMYSDYVLDKNGVKFDNILFKDKGGDIAGWYEKEQKGYLVYLPPLELGLLMNSFATNQEMVEEGNILVNFLIDMDTYLHTLDNSIFVQPQWAGCKKYSFTIETRKRNTLKENNVRIAALDKINKTLNKELQDLEEYKKLLYTKGRTLESSVSKAMKLLGFSVEENIQCGNHEIDHLLKSPEGICYIGETGGKNNIIDQKKISQLITKYGAYLEHCSQEKNVNLILFGNAFFADDPLKKKEEFSLHVKDIAQSNQCILFSTKELFNLVQYVLNNRESTDLCNIRNAIYESKGTEFRFDKLKYIFDLQEKKQA